jgi:hypothetical protein
MCTFRYSPMRRHFPPRSAANIHTTGLLFCPQTNGYQAEAAVFGLNGVRWRLVYSCSSYARMPTARHGLGAIALGHKLYVISGGSRPGPPPPRSTRFWSLKTGAQGPTATKHTDLTLTHSPKFETGRSLHWLGCSKGASPTQWVTGSSRAW